MWYPFFYPETTIIFINSFLTKIRLAQIMTIVIF